MSGISCCAASLERHTCVPRASNPDSEEPRRGLVPCFQYEDPHAAGSRIRCLTRSRGFRFATSRWVCPHRRKPSNMLLNKGKG
ncbi:hypothetical protein VTK56DRAFT_3877 [Thermocarpiscus australiensis]